MSMFDDILRGDRRRDRRAVSPMRDRPEDAPAATEQTPSAARPNTAQTPQEVRPNTLEEAFGKLLGRQPTDKEKQDLYRTRDALGLKNSDAMWLLFMALGHYETTYSTFPGLIAKAAADVAESTKATAHAQLKAASARAEAELAQAVATTAREIAERTANTKRWRWIGSCLVGSGLMFVLISGLSYRAGERFGLARGYAETRNENAATAWSNTPEGRLAYGLAKAGSVGELATCSGRGWKRRGTTCLPMPDRGSVYGWRLAEASPGQ